MKNYVRAIYTGTRSLATYLFTSTISFDGEYIASDSSLDSNITNSGVETSDDNDDAILVSNSESDNTGDSEAKLDPKATLDPKAALGPKAKRLASSKLYTK